MTRDTTSAQVDADERAAGSGVAAGVALGAAICLLLVSNLIDQQRAIARLQKADKDQTTTIAASHKAADQLNALAKGTEALAKSGDANAAAVVAILQRNGIKIKPNP